MKRVLALTVSGNTQLLSETDVVTAEGAAEEQWMQDAGLGHLSNQIKAGKPITSDDLKEETRGLTAQQVKAVQQRAETLNAYVYT